VANRLHSLLPVVTLRRILFGLAAVAVGVLIGLPMTQLIQTQRAPSEGQSTPVEATPTAVSPVRLGSDRPPADVGEAPDWVAFNQQTVQVADRVKPSVVYIEVVPDGGGVDAADPRFLTTEAGSGVLLSEDGYVLTNVHLVSGAGTVTVLLPDKREFEAEVVGRDPTTDIAVLRLLAIGDAGPLPVAAVGNSDQVQVGEFVLVVGSPFRMRNTVTSGIVSALGRSVDAIDDEFRIEDFIQTDAAVNQGNSGGALVNLRGEVIGIVTAIASESGFNEGYGFAVPSNLARRVAEDLIAYGEVRRGYLGVGIGEITAATAREKGMESIRGVLVQSVVRNGPADRAGVRAGDVLLEIGGRVIDEPNQFQSRLAQSRPAERIGLTVLRGNEPLELRAALTHRDDPVLGQWFANREAPAEAPAPGAEAPSRSEASDWGVRFRDLTAEERRSYRVTAGAFVEGIQPGSAAELDGLPSGSIVTEVEGRPVGTAEEARLALARQARQDQPALLRVRRTDGRTAFYDLASPFVD
jgi:serine protease Do